MAGFVESGDPARIAPEVVERPQQIPAHHRHPHRTGGRPSSTDRLSLGWNAPLA
jgi:hypothetical protein